LGWALQIKKHIIATETPVNRCAIKSPRLLASNSCLEKPIRLPIRNPIPAKMKTANNESIAVNNDDAHAGELDIIEFFVEEFIFLKFRKLFNGSHREFVKKPHPIKYTHYVDIQKTKAERILSRLLHAIYNRK
jgi:hypothetical protein